MTNTERDIGQLQGGVASLERQVSRLEEKVDHLADQIQKIEGTINQLSGAWKTAVIVAGVVGAIIGWLVRVWRS